MSKQKKSNGPLRCKDARKLIEKSFYGTLTIPEQINLEGHLMECSDCRLWHETEQWTRQMARSFFPQHEIPYDLQQFFNKFSPS